MNPPRQSGTPSGAASESDVREFARYSLIVQHRIKQLARHADSCTSVRVPGRSWGSRRRLALVRRLETAVSALDFFLSEVNDMTDAQDSDLASNSGVISGSVTLSSDPETQAALMALIARVRMLEASSDRGDW